MVYIYKYKKMKAVQYFDSLSEKIMLHVLFVCMRVQSFLDASVLYGLCGVVSKCLRSVGLRSVCATQCRYVSNDVTTNVMFSLKHQMQHATHTTVAFIKKNI